MPYRSVIVPCLRSARAHSAGASGDFERDLVWSAYLGDQRGQPFAQIGQRLLSSSAIADSPSARSDQRRRAPHPILILMKGVWHMHDAAHAFSLGQQATGGPGECPVTWRLRLAGGQPSPPENIWSLLGEFVSSAARMSEQGECASQGYLPVLRLSHSRFA